MPVFQALPAHKTSHENNGSDEIDATGLTGAGGGGISQITGTGDGHVVFGATKTEIYSPNGWVGGTEFSEIDAQEGIVLLWPTHTPGNFASKGVVMQVGDDGLFLYVSERTSGRLEIHPSSGASYDVEFVDAASSAGLAGPGRFVFRDDGLNKSIPSLGMARQFSSAPTAQVTGEHYYNTTTNKEYVWDGSAWQALW